MKTHIILIPKLNQEITFIIGSNAQDNVNIIQAADPNDIWFHIADYPSAHIIAHLPYKLNKKSLIPIIKQGAVLCKQVSKYANQKNLSITYTPVSNINLTDILGTVNLTISKNIII